MEIRDVNKVAMAFRKALLELDTFLAAVVVHNGELVLNEHEHKKIKLIKDIVNNHLIFKEN